MVEYTEPQDWDFDFLKTVPACQDLSRPPQVVRAAPFLLRAKARIWGLTANTLVAADLTG